ncbi:hypothetical protein RIF29_36313 [Crotalaria pallida]|uniref:Peroxidase n=1 Tax=Crotalaria pallida TaxID=3830 RepID=A0AAN9HYH1_CROPI
MARVLLGTILMFHMVLVPSMAGPAYNKNNIPFQYGQEIPKIENLIGGQVEEQDAFAYQAFAGKLKVGFYSETCPNAEKIVAEELALIVKRNPNAVPNILRLHFHDCFVGGCDASVLLDHNLSGEQVEKNSMSNGFLLKGADIVDDIKAKLEEECPETVSCADTLAFASNEALALSGLKPLAHVGGRRDALVSVSKDADNLPLSTWSVEQMINLFQQKGFTPEELVILLGAHSVGSSHCDSIMDRIYNFKGTQLPDPALPPPFVQELRQICANPGTPQFRNLPVNFDETPKVMDNLFFKNLAEKRKSLLQSDAVLMDDPRTAPTVQKMADEPAEFAKRFPQMLLKMSAMDVKTGNEGEVRKSCIVLDSVSKLAQCPYGKRATARDGVAGEELVDDDGRSNLLP